MAIKRKITKEEFENLNVSLQGEYKEQNGSYILDVDGDEEAITTLRASLASARNETASTKAEREAKQAEIDRITLELSQAKELVAAKENGTHAEVVALQAKHTKALSELATKHAEETTRLNSHLTRAFAEQPANAFFSSVGKTAAIAKMLAREYGDRFVMEMDAQGNPTTVIKDKDGSPVDVEKFKAEVYANTDLADMLRPTSGSGGGADHSGKGGNGGGQGLTLTEQHAAIARQQGNR